MGEYSVGILDKARRLLRKYPLCDFCLGRMFAKHGLGLGNDERGRAIKILLTMSLHREFAGKNVPTEELVALASNTGPPLVHLVNKLTGLEVFPRECYICGGRISRELYRSIAEKAASMLREVEAKTFLVGVVLDEVIAKREQDVALETGLEANESVKNEIKREVGKIIQAITGLQVDFRTPDAIVMVEVGAGFEPTVKLQANPVYLKGVYKKLGRNISHVPWLSRDGTKKYPLSIQEFFESTLRDLYGATKVVIHAAGREDVDARMLGSGRPLVVEIVEPRRRKISLEDVNKLLASGLVEGKITGYTSRSDVRLLKELSKHRRKVYRLLVFSEKPLDQGDMSKLEEFFTNRIVKQKTPTRVLRRKKDIERTRRVHALKTRLVTPHLFEALVYCDGGLYVKELVHCDNGRTTPCFGEVLSTNTKPLELDVLYVQQ